MYSASMFMHSLSHVTAFTTPYDCIPSLSRAPNFSHPCLFNSSTSTSFSNQSLGMTSRKRHTGHVEDLIVGQAKVCLVDYP